MEVNKIIQGDCIEGMKNLPDESVDCCVTSPPYFGLRDYGHEGQIGLEETPEMFVDKMVEVFEQVKRVLKPEGVLWLNLGDSYFGSGKGRNADGTHQEGGKQGTNKGTITGILKPSKSTGLNAFQNGNSEQKFTAVSAKMEHTECSCSPKQYNEDCPVHGTYRAFHKPWVDVNEEIKSASALITAKSPQLESGQIRPLINTPKSGGLKPKDLIGIPWMVAFALRSAGWYLRQDIIWHKPNPMPESVTDRCTKAHEYIFLLSKSSRYYYDAYAIATPYADKTFTTFGIESKGYGDGTGLIKSENWARDMKVRKPKVWKMPDGWDTGEGSHGSFHRNGREKGRKQYDKSQGGGGTSFINYTGNFREDGMPIGNGKANKRSVWSVTTQGFKDAHFATFPEDLIVDCIKAGCPENGLVLDPFMGAGTTALVARKLNRNYIGFELNPAYIEIAQKRLKRELGMFL